MPKLIVITKGVAQTVHELADGWTTIGRSDENYFQLVEQSISGRHCEVRLQGDELFVRDLLSTNGTFIGGRRVTEGVLKPGGTLRLGDVELRFDASGVQKAGNTTFNSKMLITRSADARPLPVRVLEEKNPPAPAEPAGKEPEKRFNVLFVDDSMAFIDLFGGLCVELSGLTWKLHKAASADVALDLLRQHPMDLVVLDIGMPLVDGFQLQGIINRRCPGMKIAVMTGNATEARQATALANGAELFVEKPVTPEGMQSVFHLLQDLLLLNREGFTGALRQVELAEVIRVEGNGRRSSVLEIRSPVLRGQIYIEAGIVKHAVAGELTGEAAFQKLMSLRGGEFQIKPFQPPPRQTIDLPWQYLLMICGRSQEPDNAAPAPMIAPASAPPPAPIPRVEIP